jgi:DNA polymerase-3 subunit epsilon
VVSLTLAGSNPATTTKNITRVFFNQPEGSIMNEESTNILFFDTETTGIPDWKKPSHFKTQPHIVQLAVILSDENRETIGELNVIVRPDGWTIPQETTDVHGITNEQAMDEGFAEIDALQMFIDLYQQCGLRVAHNTTFDNRIIRIALLRYMRGLIEDDEWKDRDLYYCTLMNSKKIMGGKSGHTLPEALKHFTGEELVDAHSAMGDTIGCQKLYYGIQDQA